MNGEIEEAYMWFLLIIAIVIGLDQWLKFWVTEHIGYGETLFDNNPILSLTNIHNEGAAWSILEGKMWFFYLVTFLTVGVTSFILIKYRYESKWLTIGLSLIIGGALGNFIDRLRLNYVVDMFQTNFMNFPIFNIADVALTIGVICVFIYIMLDDALEMVG